MFQGYISKSKRQNNEWTVFQNNNGMRCYAVINRKKLTITLWQVDVSSGKPQSLGASGDVKFTARKNTARPNASGVICPNYTTFICDDPQAAFDHFVAEIEKAAAAAEARR